MFEIVGKTNAYASAYDIVQSRFGFLRNLKMLAADEIRNAAAEIVLNTDLETCTGNEMIQLGDLSKLFVPGQTNKMSIQLYLYQLLANKRPNDTFPNVEISLRMFLVLTVANCSSERSFSKLKLIKNILRTSMSEDRLVGLTLLSIESDILLELNFDDIIDEFPNKKACKVCM